MIRKKHRSLHLCCVLDSKLPSGIMQMIEKVKKHIEYCDTKVKGLIAKDAYVWIVEKVSYEHTLLDLYKIRDGEEPSTDYTDLVSTVELENYK